MSTRSSFRSVCRFTTRALGLALVSTTVLAHPGHEIPGNMFLSGLSHPFTGIDHLFAIFAVGLWSALTHDNLRSAIWTPVSFLALLLIGALLGMAGVHLPAIEPIIMASLLVLGLLVASRISLPNWAGASLVGFFALFHGIAHGSELPVGGSATAFILGFMLSTFTLHVTGLTAGFTLKNKGLWLTRVAGAGIAAYGIALFTA